MTAHDETSDSPDRQAGVAITRAMVEAGVRVIAEEYGVCGESVAEGLAAEVFRAMSAAKSAPTPDTAHHEKGRS